MTDRREFLKTSAFAGAGLVLGAPRPVRAAGPNDRVTLGVMGVNGRGSALAVGFAGTGAADIAYLCDVDIRANEKAASALAAKQMATPKLVGDFRKILDDPSVDALVIAAPDHWHAPATIMACAAGKHVYVEKPASHNPREGEMAVAAARKHKRVVQLGTQRRSCPGVIEAIDKLKGGVIGKVLFSRGWYNNSRHSIGHGKPAPVPEWLDYALWQGPAPETPYRDNILHYNWHWFWQWGTGELGNNGIHALDICRWGIGADGPPSAVSAGGGHYRWPDDQETPDTHVVTFDYSDRAITWEGRSWSRRGFEGSMFGIAFYGENGTMIIDDGSYQVLDPMGKEVLNVKGRLSDQAHLLNFLDCVRTPSKRPNADIEEGHKSTMLCHLGNIAWRSGQTLQLDPKTGKPNNAPGALSLWGREYRKGWEPKL